MARSKNPFANYTLSITTQYKDTHESTIIKKVPKRKYSSMDDLLRETVFLGATRFGSNFIA